MSPRGDIAAANSSQRRDDGLTHYALVAGHGPQNGVERANSKNAVIRNGNPLM